MLKEDITEIEDPVKQDIINRFKLHVQNVDICLTDYTITHCGKEGHWLETKMGLTHNSKNEPDINGYELKTGEKVTTFIDKIPNCAFINGMEISLKNKTEKSMFWEKYGCKKETNDITIGGWKIDKYNKCGQKLCVDDDNNILILYNYEYDERENKDPLFKTPHIIMKWNADTLKNTIENKFNKKGFIKCIKHNNKFIKLCFGPPITFNLWINEIKKGNIYHDGYSKLNGRGRHVYRASNSFWNQLITEEYS